MLTAIWISFFLTFIVHVLQLCTLKRKLVFMILRINAKDVSVDKEQVLHSCLHFHYLSLTDSIKPSLQFSFLYFGLVALEGSTFTRIVSILFIFQNTDRKMILQCHLNKYTINLWSHFMQKLTIQINSWLDFIICLHWLTALQSL